MRRRLFTILLALVLLASSSVSGQVLYLCSIDQQMHWHCCCSGAEERSPHSSPRKDECCCDLQLVEKEPIRLNPLSRESASYAPFLIALPAISEILPYRQDSLVRFRTQRLYSFPVAPPLFLQNCSYLI